MWKLPPALDRHLWRAFDFRFSRLACLGADDEGAPPFRPQDTGSLRVTLVEKTRCRHPGGSEASEVLAQFAPGDQVTDRLQIADGHRPDRACGLTTLLVAVA